MISRILSRIVCAQAAALALPGTRVTRVEAKSASIWASFSMRNWRARNWRPCSEIFLSRKVKLSSGNSRMVTAQRSRFFQMPNAFH